MKTGLQEALKIFYILFMLMFIAGADPITCARKNDMFFTMVAEDKTITHEPYLFRTVTSLGSCLGYCLFESHCWSLAVVYVSGWYN